MRIVGSRDLLAQALGNLLDNAITYTPMNGAIQLRISQHAGAAEVSVADNGLGIPESEYRRVLERFARLHQAELILVELRPGLMVTIRFPCAAEAR